MKLERFRTKNKKKKVILNCCMAIVLFVAGIMVYRSFALYEEKHEFDVIKGSIPDQNYDLMLSYTITDQDGNKTNRSVVPEKSNEQKYEVEVNCDHAEGSWDYEEWNVTVNVKEKTKCKINFKENNDFIYPTSENIENGKKLLAEAITSKGVQTNANVSLEQMALNIKSINQTVRRVQIGTGNSSSARSFSATSIPNYNRLNVTNFVVSVTTMTHQYSSNFSENVGNLTTGISYNANTGVLNVPSSVVKGYFNGSGQSFDKAFVNYTVYCYY